MTLDGPGFVKKRKIEKKEKELENKKCDIDNVANNTSEGRSPLRFLSRY